MSNTPSKFLVGCASFGAAAISMSVTGQAVAKEPPAKSPNFLFILTDDQQYGALGAAGNKQVQTPAMDRLVAQGTYFTQASIMGSNSAAVCMPSRAMIMTGNGLFRCQGTIPLDSVTLPQLLGQNNYTTFVTGKWHNDEASLLRSFQRGEAIFVGGMGDHFKTPVRDIRQGKLVDQRVITDFDAEVFTTAAIRFLKQAPIEKPFFVYLSFKTPHDPRAVPKKFHERYDPQSIPLPPNFLPRHPFDNGEMNIRDEKLAKFPRSENEIWQHLAAYYAATSATDEQIGRVLAALDELHLADNTVVVFTSDNGLAVGQHGLMGKQNLYDHSVRVPLVLRGPGIPQGKRSEALCQLYDLYPTLAALAGLKPPAGLEGKDLTPVLRGAQADVRDATLHAYREIQRAVRTRDAKLIEYSVQGQRTTQLFDLKNDPWETTNLAGDQAHASLLAEMRQRMEQLSREQGAPALGQKIPGPVRAGAGRAHPEANE